MPFGYNNVWEDSDIKYWLNTTFMNTAFTQAEQSAIYPSGSLGKIFLLSEEELRDTSYGFHSDRDKNDTQRRAKGTRYAKERNLYVHEENQCSTYYTRSAPNGKNVTTVRSTGSLGIAKVDRTDIGIRPAMWVNIQALNLQNGNGTADYPYQ